MKSKLLMLFVIFYAFVGCDQQQIAPAPKKETPTNRITDDQVRSLGDKITSLSNADAVELSTYLRDIHGIASAGENPSAEVQRRNKESFDVKIASLGEQIAALSIADAKLLSDYLASKYDIKAAN